MADPYDRSVMLFVTAAQRDNANLVYAAMGRGPNTFSVPCSATGDNPATHYAAHDASMDASLSNIALDMPQNGGTAPDIDGDWLDFFTSAPNETAARGMATAACNAMQVSVMTGVTSSAHSSTVLSGLSLQVIQPEL